MNQGSDIRAEQLMQLISAELVGLRSSIVHRNLTAIELHTRQTRDMLTELRPLLTREKRPLTTELMELRSATQGCTALLNHVRRTVRALLGLYRSFGDDIPNSHGAGL